MNRSTNDNVKCKLSYSWLITISFGATKLIDNNGKIRYTHLVNIIKSIQISAGYKTGNAIHAAVTEEDTSTAVFGQLACNKFLKIPSECIATQIPILYKTAIDSRTPFTDLYCAKR